jgi:hypothetical protein
MTRSPTEFLPPVILTALLSAVRCVDDLLAEREMQSLFIPVLCGVLIS